LNDFAFEGLVAHLVRSQPLLHQSFSPTDPIAARCDGYSPA
jgi:hypothetical protein